MACLCEITPKNGLLPSNLHVSGTRSAFFDVVQIAWGYPDSTMAGRPAADVFSPPPDSIKIASTNTKISKSPIYLYSIYIYVFIAKSIYIYLKFIWASPISGRFLQYLIFRRFLRIKIWHHVKYWVQYHQNSPSM